MNRPDLKWITVISFRALLGVFQNELITQVVRRFSIGEAPNHPLQRVQYLGFTLIV
jgi:hypothetical protein